MLLPRGEIADGLLGARGCVGGGHQVARRPARGLSSPLWSMAGLAPTMVELQRCVLHHGFRKRRKLQLAKSRALFKHMAGWARYLEAGAMPQCRNGESNFTFSQQLKGDFSGCRAEAPLPCVFRRGTGNPPSRMQTPSEQAPEGRGGTAKPGATTEPAARQKNACVPR